VFIGKISITRRIILKTKSFLTNLMLIIVLMTSIELISAQDTSFSLRGFASQNDIYIGTAAWTNHLNNPTHSEIVGREFNMFTPEHEAKWCMISAQRDLYNFSKFDELVDFAEENDMVIHGHALIWHSCSPNWVENADLSREEAIEVLREHITTVVERYKGRILYWDVVNEAFDGDDLRDTAWLRMIGEDYIELAFQFAHEADPDALLLYNDYGAEDMNAKSNAIYAMAQDFIERDIPLHGIGMQSHMTLGRINFSSIAENIQRLGELGLEVQLTEVDIRYPGESDDETLQQQASDYYHLMETCLDSEACTAFIVWGVTDKLTWLRGDSLGFYLNTTVEPLLFDDDYQPKPAYFALMDFLARRVGATSILSDSQIAAILGDESIDTELPEPTKSDPNQLSPDSVPGLAYYAPVGVTIMLDGDLSDWENVPRVTVDSGNMIPANHDTSFEFAVAVDDINLYYMANVTDSTLVFGQYSTSNWYREDSIEFYLNTTGDLSASSYGPGIVQIGIMLANIAESEEPLIGGDNSDSIPVSFVVVTTEAGYVVEASVPLVTDEWEITPEHMGVLGFQTHLNGSSDDDRDTKLIWSAADTQDQSYNNPSLFGQLIFWNITQ
jgi:endo-1,4-beta-xylanase